jgi:diguanylate cyclase (GGDEF)-like protein/PAS domain S-box-containing protein
MEIGSERSVFTGYHKAILWLFISVVSVLVILFLIYRELSSIERHFNTAAMAVQRDVIQQVASLDTVLTALVGQHHASSALNSAELTLFSQEMLKSHPFIHSILYLERVSHQDLDEFKARMHESGFVSFRFDQNASPPNAKKESGLGYHLLVSFIEPMTPRSGNLLGFDLGNQPFNSEVIEKAIRLGTTIGLDGIRVPRFKEPLSLILKPVYQGRYPPVLPHERWEMLSGIVALRIDYKQFFKEIKLNSKEMQLALFLGNQDGELTPESKLLEWGAKKTETLFSLPAISFAQPLEIHGLSFTLSIRRDIAWTAINIWKVAIEWLLIMLMLALLVVVYRNRRLSKLQKEVVKSAIAAKDARLLNVIDAAFDAVITTDHEGRILSWNQQASEIFGYEEDAVANRKVFPLILSSRSFDEHRHKLEPLFQLKGQVSYKKSLEAIGQTKSGQQFPLELAISSSIVGAMPMLSVFARDITERKRRDEKINYLAYCDSLTDLPNRLAFKEQVTRAIKSANRYGRIGAVLYLDLDEFKRINDTLGHDIGDLLLKHITKRLEQQLRSTDMVTLYRSETESTCNIARLGGDEFTVLLEEIDQPDAAAIVAKRVQNAIVRSYNLNGHEIYVTPSIGIALFPRDGQDVDELLKNADTAMYHAKAMGKNNFQFYTDQMNAMAANRLKLEGKLRKALVCHEMELHYQPQIDLESGELVAAEALLRWNQSELGMIPPSEFIPLAEETGMIIELAEWVLNEACQQNKSWQNAGYHPIRIAINLSGMQFIRRDLNERVQYVLAASGLDPKYLEFEITESIIMRNVNETITALNEFKDMGISISVDDFGTGYSSLSYLKRFPLDVLKIDRSFVNDIPDNQDDVTITSAIIALAHRLNLGVVAEGVETRGQLDFLHQQGCDLAQGNYFSNPLPAYEFELLLSERVNSGKYKMQLRG